jgi:katanin p80 WD40 repeat-containing subunit B1
MTAGKLLKTYTEAKAAITSLNFNPAEFMVASSSIDGCVRFYDLQTLALISETPQLSSTPHNVTFHPDGQEVLIGCEESLQVSLLNNGHGLI